MPKKKEFAFGEIVKVKDRKNGDPTKFQKFVREVDRRMYQFNAGIYFELTDGEGTFGMYKPSRILPLSKADKKFLGIDQPTQPVDPIISVLIDYGDTDGAHHKQYAIDRALRFIMGEDYAEFAGKNPDWDTGIP
jgi:hypothetical protein